MDNQVELYKRFAECDPMVVYLQVWDSESKSWIDTDELVDLETVNVFDQDRVEKYSLTDEQQEYYNQWAEELGKDCPNPDCICKKGNDG